MHEMSIAISLLQMAQKEAARAGCNRLLNVTVEYGQISGIMPEALEMAFNACVSDTIHAGARLELRRIPLKLRCLFCGCVFGDETAGSSLIPCPQCGEILGHGVEQGKELVLARIEAVAQTP